MDLDEARELASLALPDVFPRVGSADDGPWSTHAIGRDVLPLPELVLVGLRELRGLKSWGPEEKLRWGVDGRVGTIPFSMTLQKFGPRLYLPSSVGKAGYNTVLSRLQKAASLAERYLKSLAQAQIEAGNVTIVNEYSRFDGAYRFFREAAKKAYDAPPPNPVVTATDEAGAATGWSHEPFRPQVEGGYLAGAMLDAYFSRLEHMLVLFLPFAGFDPENSAVVRFVGSTWDEKWKRLFDVNSDKSAKLAYDSLKQLKESVRNPIAHGGFGKKGTSFLFHVERVGALPALLGNHGHTTELSITRIPEGSYDGLCRDLDAVDSFLRRSDLWAAMQYAEAGLNVPLDPDFRQKCMDASRSESDMQEFLEYVCYVQDTHANMDY